MSYQVQIDPRKRVSGRLIARVRRALLQAFAENRDENGATQQAIASKLGVNRSVINKMLSGEANLTLRSLAELAWALDRNIIIDLEKKNSDHRRNQTLNSKTTSSISDLNYHKVNTKIYSSSPASEASNSKSYFKEIAL